ncbi:MAG: hypothetical protein GY796_10030, partial [Chloroflexi bacterium]|nr:hypothetical protein [Chloroflexota bacterium]
MPYRAKRIGQMILPDGRITYYPSAMGFCEWGWSLKEAAPKRIQRCLDYGTAVTGGTAV